MEKEFPEMPSPRLKALARTMALLDKVKTQGLKDPV
jgi:hypothetical protein